MSRDHVMPTMKATPRRDGERLLTPEEAAAHLGMSKSWIYKRTADGSAPVHRIGGKVRFTQRDLDAWIALNSQSAQAHA
jgi:excisionase family DNA binding protein